MSALAIPLCALTTPAAAQKSDAAVQADLEFARGLAEEWQFVGLAEDVLRQIEAEGVSPARTQELALIKCDIFRSAASNERDRSKRNQLFDQAIAAYESFVDSYQLSDRRWEAELGLVRTAGLYARSLEISLEEAVGDEAERLAERRKEVLNQAIVRSSDLVDSLLNTPERSSAQTRELSELMLTRVQMLYDLARSQEEGSFYFAQAIETATKLVFLVGEDSPAALRAFDLIGRVYAAQQKWEEASYFFASVIDRAIPPDPAQWQELVREASLDQAAKEQRWIFLELSSAGLARVLVNMGDLNGATRYALHYYNTQRREGFSFSPSLGYPTLLSIARLLLDAGGWIGGDITRGEAGWYPSEEAARADHPRRNVLSTPDLALRIARQVRDDNKGNILQLHAQRLIAEVASQPGMVIEPELLFEAAQAEFHDGNLPGAVDAFQRLLGDVASRDAATRTFFAPRICWWLGRTFQRMDRPLEAAMAFREGVTTWQGDPEFDAQNATNFYRSIDMVRAADREAKVYVDLFREAETLNTRFATANRDEILFTQAERERTARNYDAAIELYKQIEAGADVHERALVGIAESTFRKSEIEEADRLFGEYVEDYVNDPARSVDDSPRRRANRHLALAKAKFYRALIAHGRASATPTAVDLWQRVIELTEGYHEEYADQGVLAAWCLEMALEAHIALRDIEGARARYHLMTELFADNARTARGAFRFYTSLEALRAEADQEGNIERARELELEMARLLETGNKLASSPNFNNLRAESRHWMSLGEYEKAEAILRRLVTTFGEAESAERASVDKFVRPDLGLALLALERTGDARAVLEPLVKGEGAAPSKDTVVAYCRSLLGWVEPMEGRLKIVPGAAETAQDLQGAIDLYSKLDKAAESWHCEWYGYKFMIAYAYHVWATADGGPKDPDKRASLETQLGQLTIEVGASFDHIAERCEGDEARTAQAIHGPGDLRAKFRWLRERAR